jgi:hypothetical protein
MKIDHVIREDEGEDLSQLNWIQISNCEYAVDSESRRIFENWLIQKL